MILAECPYCNTRINELDNYGGCPKCGGPIQPGDYFAGAYRGELVKMSEVNSKILADRYFLTVNGERS